MSAIFTTAQTNVSGGIYTNTTWTKVNSPYIVTGNIVVFPGNTLTIQPGVEVKFDGWYNIEIRGTLLAIGTITDSISFVSINYVGINDSISFVSGSSLAMFENVSFHSDSLLSKSSWGKISISNASQNAVGLFEYCFVKHSSFGVAFECCSGNASSYIKNSRFDNNNVASSGHSGWDLSIDNCVFTNNNRAIESGYKTITNSTFINNGIGINCEFFEAKNCLFQNNGLAIDWMATVGGTAYIDSCIILNNFRGISVYNGSITNCNISNNLTTGLVTGHLSSTINGIEYNVPIKNNRICNNTQYNIKNYNSSNKNITRNCFCTNDSATIESKLFDGYDDITLGLFNYDIYDSACQNITQSVYKIGINPLSSNTVISKEPNISIFPNPFNDYISIQLNNQSNQLYSLRIYNALGQTVQQFENINSEQKTIDCGNFKSGIYLLQLIQNGIIIGHQKLIKQ